jgi:predicted secreted protein
MVVLDAKDNGRTIELPVGARFGVDLAVQVGTGFVWLVTGEMPEGLQLISSETLRSGQTGKVGGPGIQRLILQVMRTGRFTLSLAYRRPWEKRSAAQTFSIIVISR